MGVLFIILFNTALHVSAYKQAIFRCFLINHKNCIEPVGFLPCSRESCTYPHPESDQSMYTVLTYLPNILSPTYSFVFLVESFLFTFLPKPHTHSPPPYSCYMPSSFYPLWHLCSNFIRLRAHVTKFPIM
jgi:hypothetical protein